MNDNTIVGNQDDVPILANALGCKLVPSRGENGWGIGTFFINGKQIGSRLDHFFAEESTGKQFRADSVEVLENSLEQGTLRFTGADGKVQFTADITLRADSHAYEVSLAIDPLHPIYHSIFAEVPLLTDAFDFIKYPFEDTILPSDGRRFLVETDAGRAPFMFARESVEEQPCFIGVGYNLTDQFDVGRIEFDPHGSTDAPIRIYAPFKGMARNLDLQCVTRLELLRGDFAAARKSSVHHFRYVISTAPTQYQCLRSYAQVAEYSVDVATTRSVDDSVAALMKLYKTTPGYVEGLGYHQLIRVDTGDFDTTVPHGWYSKYLAPGPQVQLGYELYQHWKSNPNERWARQRAIEMSDFLVSQQNEDGSYGNWDTDTGSIGMMHPGNTEGAEHGFNQYIYSTSDIAMGAYHLYKLYDDLQATEGIIRTDWLHAAQRSITYVAGLVSDDGLLGRNYSAGGGYDKVGTALAEVLLALDYMHSDTGAAELMETRLRLETWLYSNFLQFNSWADGCMDGGAWMGTEWPPPRNNDSVGIQAFVSYCAEMHRKYQETRYLDMAKDVFMYQWSITVPVQMEGFTNLTRGLMREQDFYSAFDLPIKINDYIDCLPYLSKVTGDPFFMEYFRVILQTQISYQERVEPFAGMHIGLECDETGRRPIDKIAEGHSAYIVRFSSMFIKSVRGPIAYQYVGGEGWGLGRDYNLAFDADLGPGNPYLLSSTSLVRDLSWSAAETTLDILVYDRLSPTTDLEVRWETHDLPIDEFVIEQGNDITPAADFFDARLGVLTLTAASDAPSRAVRIRRR